MSFGKSPGISIKTELSEFWSSDFIEYFGRMKSFKLKQNKKYKAILSSIPEADQGELKE